MYCDICGEPMKKVTWYEEIWGSRRKITEWECTNENCGEEEEEEEDDDVEDVEEDSGLEEKSNVFPY